MKVCIVHPYVVASSDPESKGVDYYHKFSQRFVESYKIFKPKLEHEFLLISNGGSLPGRAIELFSGIPMHRLNYFGNGWWEGACQLAAHTLDCDLMVCLVTSVYFHRDGWLERLVEAVQQFGDGLFGATASFENRPHLRLCSFACSPSLLRSYPHVISSKSDAYKFESGDACFAEFVESKDKPVILTAWSGFYQKPDWRKPENGFRSGDETDCLVLDYHCDVYAQQNAENKSHLTRISSGN